MQNPQLRKAGVTPASSGPYIQLVPSSIWAIDDGPRLELEHHFCLQAWPRERRESCRELVQTHGGGDHWLGVDAPRREHRDCGFDLAGLEAEAEAQVEFLVHRSYRAPRILLHADADHHDSSA